MGEGLSPDDSRDATFMPTGAGTWVGKPAYLAADPLTIQEGWQEIAWAVTKCWIKVGGLGHPHMNLLIPQPFRFDQQGDSPQKDTPRDVNSDHQLSSHQPLRGKNHNRCRRDQGLLPPQPHWCRQIVGFKAIGVWCQWPHWCHHCQTGQKIPSVPREVDDVGKLEPTWKVIYPSLKKRMQRMLWPNKVGGGIWLYTIVSDAKIIPSSCTLFSPCKVTLEN